MFYIKNINTSLFDTCFISVNPLSYLSQNKKQLKPAQSWTPKVSADSVHEEKAVSKPVENASPNTTTVRNEDSGHSDTPHSGHDETRLSRSSETAKT